MPPRKTKIQVDSNTLDSYSLLPYTAITKSHNGNSLTPTIGQGYIADIELSEDRYQFNLSSSPDPNFALSIFVKCLKMGYYPPVEVLTFISDKFKDYLESDNITLDSAIGLNKRNKKKYNINKRNKGISHSVYTLKNIFGITVEEALGIVKTMYANNKGMYFEETTLTDINYRGGREQLNRGLGFENDDLLWYEKMSSEYRAEWLNEYSSHFTKEDKEFLENKLSEKAIKDKSKA